MDHLRNYLFFSLLMCLVKCSNADLTLFSHSPKSLTTVTKVKEVLKYLCNDTITFMCEIERYQGSATFKINGNIFVDCGLFSCDNFLQPNGTASLSQYFNSSYVVLNVTLNPIQFTDNGTVFLCEDGAETKSIEAIVKVSPSGSTILDESVANQLSATTGCIYPYTADELQITWSIFKDGMQPKAFPGNVSGYVQNVSLCETGLDCEGNGTAKIENTIYFEETGNDTYYIQVNISHTTYPSSFTLINTQKQYRLSLPSKPEVYNVEKKVPDGGKIAGIAVGCVVFIIALGVLLFCCKRKEKSKPDEPINFKVARITETTITVQWEPGNDGGYPQTFILTYLDKKDKIHDHKKGPLQHIINNLLEGTYYDIKIRAENKIGSSTEVGPLQPRTNGKPDSPTDFIVESGGEKKTSIAVKWKRGFNGGFRQTFIITGTEREIKVPDDESAPVLHCTLRRLKKATCYQLQIRAENEKGTSQQSTPLAVRTKGEPDPPMDFGVVENGVTESSIAVGWKPGENGGFEQKFTLTCLQNGTEIQNGIRNENDPMQYEWKNLSKETWYDITIIATNQEGSSRTSEPLHVRTLGRPDPPTDFSAVKDGVTKSSIDVSWKPSFDGGFHQTFILECFKNGTDLQKTEEVYNTNEQVVQYTIKQLSVCTKYELYISSRNEKGTSESVPPVCVRTKGFPHESQDSIQ